MHSREKAWHSQRHVDWGVFHTVWFWEPEFVSPLSLFGFCVFTRLPIYELFLVLRPHEETVGAPISGSISEHRDKGVAQGAWGEMGR